MLTLVQRKIFNEIIQVFSLTLFVTLCLILMSRFLQMRELIFGVQLSVLDIALSFVYMSPMFLQLATPIAVMLSIFIVFLRLENDQEMVALRAGGISLYQLIFAPIFLAVIVGFATFWLAIYGISWGMYSFRDMLIDVAASRAKVVVQAGVFNKEIPQVVLYAKNVEPMSGFMSDVFVQDTRLSNGNERQSISILAPEGDIDVDNERGELLFLLKNGNIYSHEESQASIISFREYIMRIPLNSIFSGLNLGNVPFREMSYAELKEYPLEELKISNPKLANKVLVELHKRYVFPFACLVLGMLAIPLTFICAGSNKRFGLGLALVLFLVYYGSITLGINMGESGLVNASLALWLPNFLFFAFGIMGIYYFNNTSYRA